MPISVSRREFLQAGAMAMASTGLAGAHGGTASAPLPVKAPRLRHLRHGRRLAILGRA